MDCECFMCEGTGDQEIEEDCPCDGCVEGYHAYDFPCGQVVDGVPCEKCEANGWIKKMVKCEDCGGTGQKHEFKSTGIQKGLDGSKSEVLVCDCCNHSELKKEVPITDEESKK